jgi:phenylpropionate dioxygenase-like ring-hydroxylating dioxygenase large terminal subunit
MSLLPVLLLPLLSFSLLSALCMKHQHPHNLLRLSSSASSVWTNRWYPFAVVADLDSEKIHSMTLLGKDLVFWKDKNNTWAVAEDACPHRLAPLSKGFLNENRELTCSYHAWSFNSTGHCVCMPQARDDSVVDNPRALLQSYPVMERQGLLWLFANHTHHPLAPSIPIYTDSFFDDASFIQKDFPVDYANMLENTFDPSHAQILHSQASFFGLKPFSVDDAVPMRDFRVTENITSRGFQVEHSGYSVHDADTMHGTRTLIAPVTNRVHYDNYTSRNLIVDSIFYFVPIKPGYTRAIGAFKVTRPSSSKLFQHLTSSIFPRNLIWLQRGLFHLSGHRIDEQDIFMMHFQQYIMQQRNGSWQTNYFLPDKADKGVSAFRTWFDRFSSGQVRWLQSPVSPQFPLLSEDLLLDRWTRHTSNCLSCQRTLAFFKSAYNVLNVVCLFTLAKSIARTFSLLSNAIELKIVLVPQLLTCGLWWSFSILMTKVLAVVRRTQRGFIQGSYPFSEHAIPLPRSAMFKKKI